MWIKKPWILATVLWAVIAAPTQSQEAFVRFDNQTTQIPQNYLKYRIDQHLSKEGKVQPKQLKAYLKDLYLQRGNPNAQIRLIQDSQGIRIHIDENLSRSTVVKSIKIKGGTPQQRYITWLNIQEHTRKGLAFQSNQLKNNLAWIEKNHFIPLFLIYKSKKEGEIDIVIDIFSGRAIVPTGNVGWNSLTGLSVTAGAIFYDTPENHLFRAMVKRNNFDVGFLGITSSKEAQDWEYILTWSTGQLPIPGMSFGVNHYNKVDYIYPGIEPGKNLWIQSFGADLYSGFPLWSNPRKKQYLRGIANLSFIRDSFNTSKDSKKTATEYTQSKRRDDRLILPSITLVYSDIDDYILPYNGSFVRGTLSGGFGDASFGQGTLSAISFLTPSGRDGNWQNTWLFRNAVGSTFGLNPPFYRGFLNTGPWLVRGATAFSVTEKHAIRTAQEYHWIYRPKSLAYEQAFQTTLHQSNPGFLDKFAFDINLFLDQGAYWSTGFGAENLQASIGLGLNTRTPAGTILGIDIASSVYPNIGSPSVLLRIQAPLSFTLYSDWINSNGFFIR